MGTGGLQPVLEQLLLEADNGGEHRFVLDLGGWDDDAAVHEVGHTIHQLTGGLRLKCYPIEDLGWKLWRGLDHRCEEKLDVPISKNSNKLFCDVYGGTEKQLKN